MFDQNHEPPVSLAGMPCIHTAPSLKKIGEKWEKDLHRHDDQHPNGPFFTGP
jgi:hypothetical protein